MKFPAIIAIEGIDAAAKQTQSKLLVEHINSLSNQKPCFALSFPDYSTPIGKLIASKLKGEWECTGPANESVDEMKRRRKNFGDLNALVLQSLMIANKLELAGEIERANVTEGRNVVLDRYIVSGIAYGQADGLNRALLETLHARLPKAHHVFIDIPVEESFKRRPKREDAYEADRARLERARKNYLAEFARAGIDLTDWVEALHVRHTDEWDNAFRRAPSGYAIVNGLGTVEEVHARVKMALEI